MSSSSLSFPTENGPPLISGGGAGCGAGSAAVVLTAVVDWSVFVASLLVASLLVASLPFLAAPLPVAPALAQQAASAAVTNPFAGRADVIDDGRRLFNQYCGHCHGTNAFQGERSRDLRRLSLRYGPEAPRVFYETVTTGKLDKGMPVWKNVLSDDALWQIFTFLESVQTPP